MLQKVDPNSSIGNNPFPTTCAVPGDVNPTLDPTCHSQCTSISIA